MAQTLRKESRLPRWAQEELEFLRSKIDELGRILDRTQEAAAITADGHDWFVVRHPKGAPDLLRLWTLDEMGAHPVCTLGPGDALLVGRGSKNERG